MGATRLTKAMLDHAWHLASGLPNVGPGADWCARATEAAGAYLRKKGVDVTEYYSGINRFGGCRLDATHCYLVLADGTIVDPTVTQFAEGARYQQRVARWFPTRFGVATVAVVPPRHEYVARMGYESHLYGLGFKQKPAWVPYNPRAEAARAALADAAYETPADLLTWPDLAGRLFA